MQGYINNNEIMIRKINEIISSRKNCVINIVNDKLTLSVFAVLQNNLKNVKEINLIIRNPINVMAGGELEREFEIDARDTLFGPYDIRQKNSLAHFQKARLMHEFIRDYVNIKRTKNTQVRGNVLIIDEEYAICGSSSLEMGTVSKNEVNFDTMLSGSDDVEQIRGMKRTFDLLWYDDNRTENFKPEILQSLSYVFKDHSPEFLYYFTLNELFGSQLDLSIDRFEKDPTDFKKTKIWNSLYSFQKECVVQAIKKIKKYNGCIIADSVGLGKTYEALAVIKYFELLQDNVLVLTPAKLYDNWMSFKGAYRDSELGEDFNYKIMFHTDLNRTKGESRSGYDLARFDWSKYDLVVIDESHNFRNRTEKDYEEEGWTRYQRLLEDVIMGKQKTKVLLLSATPVNNSLVDLKNQISLITADNDSAFIGDDVPSVASTLRVTSTIINAWDRIKVKDKKDLFDKLPADFYKLLELITIARSRKHITTYFSADDIGKFPEKLKPDTLTPDYDSQGELLRINETNDLLEQLKLAIYTPMQYIKSEWKQFYRDKYKTMHKGKELFFQEDREKYASGMQRFNLFKRLESSVFAFSETIRRLLERINNTITLLNRQNAEVAFSAESEDDYDTLDYKLEIKVSHLRTSDYIYDLEYDREILQEIYKDVKTILSENRDEKLKTLQAQLQKKITEMQYNAGNRKLLIFTAFADTAKYLYKEIKPILDRERIGGAVVVGTGKPQVCNTSIHPEYNDVLRAFSPKAKKCTLKDGQEIDILIATDCISEGQNLQDCDCVINYDIHWNPVTLIQRFGRIDRIGSKNDYIKMINFFPNLELNEYLDLERRVKKKIVLTNLTATGDEDFLNPELNEISFRRKQLEKLRDEVIDIDDVNDSISLTDLNMNEYLYELSQYIKHNPEIRKTPKGILSLTDGETAGVVFCFKHTEQVEKPKNDSSLYPYYLIYVGNDGTIKVGNDSPRNLLKLYRKMTMDKSEPNKKLVESFMRETKDMTEMTFYSELLNKAIDSIQGKESTKAEQTIFDFGGYNNQFEYSVVSDFELISFLIVR